MGLTVCFKHLRQELSGFDSLFLEPSDLHLGVLWVSHHRSKFRVFNSHPRTAGFQPNDITFGKFHDYIL